MSGSAQSDYIMIGDGNGREWVFPVERVKKGLSIYQPSSLRARALASALAAAPRGALRIIAQGCRLNEFLDDDCIAYLRERFTGDDVFFSLFMGTPSPHQKATVQVFNPERILAYCKVSKSPDVHQLFRAESDLLQYFDRRGVMGVPRSLGIETLGASCLFLQDTRKTFKAQTPHRLLSSHRDFAVAFASSTQVVLPFCESDFYEVLAQGLGMCSALPDQTREVFESAAEATIRHWSGQRLYSASHRDFAPWNTCLGPEGLFAFDFEYGRKSYPQYLDLHNFVVSVGMHVRRMDAVHIQRAHAKVFGNSGDMLLVACLLDKISQYLARRGRDDMDTVRRYCEILKVVWSPR